MTLPDSAPAGQSPHSDDTTAHNSAPPDTSPPAAARAPYFEPLPPPGIPRLHNFHFHSAILPDDRTISVYLPPQYESEASRHFPVFYLHDGQNLFDPSTSYIPGHTWRAGETADRLNAENRAQPLILVGIANTGLRRMAEYTPTRDYRMGGGEGRAYGRLLIEELKPWIDHTFRTNPEPTQTGLGGSSLGGLITLYLGLRYPDVFTRLAVMSPSIWWDQRSILSFVAAAKPKPPLRIWLDIGTAEGPRHVRDTELLERRLMMQGWVPGQDLELMKARNAVHTEDAWADRFDQVLNYLFPPAF